MRSCLLVFNRKHEKYCFGLAARLDQIILIILYRCLLASNKNLSSSTNKLFKLVIKKLILLKVLRCVTFIYIYISKHARCMGVQKPLALTSDLAPGPLMVDFKSKVSPVMGINAGSIATSLHTFDLLQFPGKDVPEVEFEERSGRQRQILLHR